MAKYLEEFRDPALARGIVQRLQARQGRPVNLMEVCGTHSVAIFRHGLRQLLPQGVKMLSGPGCPVCVTPNGDLDWAIALARQPDVILATYGDMLKVPGSYSSLAQAKAEGCQVKVVYSTLDALKLAQSNPGKRVVFLAVGFETTAPTAAASIVEAQRHNIKNYLVFSVHKLIPPAMKALLDSGEVRIDGFLCPGHVSTVIGAQPYEFIARDYGVPCVIAGFEPLDILQAIDGLLRQIDEKRAEVGIQYSRAVRRQGNPTAVELMGKVFRVSDAAWRGLGTIPGSGLKLSPAYADFDAELAFNIEVPPPKEHPGCGCGEVLRGVKEPPQCPLFAKVCRPENPLGPCMVSSEGSCAAWYHYGAWARSAA